MFVGTVGTGTVLELGSEEYNALLPPERRKPGSRAIIDVRVHRVSTVSILFSLALALGSVRFYYDAVLWFRCTLLQI